MKRTFPINDAGDGYKVKTPSNVEIDLPEGLRSYSQFDLLDRDGILDADGDIHKLPFLPLDHMFYLVDCTLKEAKDKEVRNILAKTKQNLDTTLIQGLEQAHEITRKKLAESIVKALLQIERGGPTNRRIGG